MRTFLAFFGLALGLTSCGPDKSGQHLFGPANSWRLNTALGIVHAQVGTAQQISFFAEELDHTKPVIAEYPGTLGTQERGGDMVVTYSDDESDTIVGRAADGRMEICSNEFASVCDFSLSYIRSNDGDDPGSVYTASLEIKTKQAPAASRASLSDIPAQFSLEQYVLAAPNQNEAGSCLFMASTGAMEILLNQQAGLALPAADGATDLSERHLMNAYRQYALPYFLTDTVTLYNADGGGLLNRDYRYTKGWHSGSGSSAEKAPANAEGAKYGTTYNWINEYDTPLRGKLTPTPKVARTLIFVDPARDRKSVATMGPEVVDQIKQALVRRQAPVLIVYNHFNIWHAVLIVGYDDDAPSNGCPFVRRWIDTFPGTEKAARIETTLAAHGGCRSSGVFLIRDSIYGDAATSPLYDYDHLTVGDEAPYAKKIVRKEYEWAELLGNHAYSIQFED